MATISLNVLAQFVQDKHKLDTVLQRLKPSVVVVIDEHTLALHLREMLPETTIIFRAWHPQDHEYWQWLTPAQWLDQHQRFATNGIVLYLLNEPSGQDNLRQLAAWCADVMALAAARGVRLALPNFSVGNPREGFGGELDALWHAFDAYPQHLLAVHEYAVSSTTAEPWHVGRYRALLARCRQLGLKPPRAVVTEFGRDIGGGALDGWRGAGFSEARYADFLLSGMRMVYAADGVDACVFGYGAGADGRWQSFDVEGAGEVTAALIEWNGRQTMPADFGTLYAARVTDAHPAGSVLRDAPAAGGAAVGALRIGDAIRISENFETGDGYHWHKVVKDGVTGYVADTNAFAWERTPPPDVPDGIYSPFLSADEIQQAIALHSAIAEAHRGIAALYSLALERTQAP